MVSRSENWLSPSLNSLVGLGGVEEEEGVDERGWLGAKGLKESRIASRLVPVSRSLKKDGHLKKDQDLKKIKPQEIESSRYFLGLFTHIHGSEMLVSDSLVAQTALCVPVIASHVPSGTDSFLE